MCDLKARRLSTFRTASGSTRTAALLSKLPSTPVARPSPRGNFPILTRVGPEGIEPSTRGLKVRCSTTELQARARRAGQTILMARRPFADTARPLNAAGSSAPTMTACTATPLPS